MINWAATAAIAAMVGILTTIVAAAFAGGKFVERIQAVEERADGHESIQKEHSQLLGEHSLQIDRLEQWRTGFNAAANLSGGTVQHKGDH